MQLLQALVIFGDKNINRISQVPSLGLVLDGQLKLKTHRLRQ